MARPVFVDAINSNNVPYIIVGGREYEKERGSDLRGSGSFPDDMKFLIIL